MKTKETLRQFIKRNELDPERANELDWYLPDECVLEEQKKSGKDDLYIFKSTITGVRCAILDTDTTSLLMGEDELLEFESNEEV